MVRNGRVELGPRSLCILGRPKILAAWLGAFGIDILVHNVIEMAIFLKFSEQTLQSAFSKQGGIFLDGLEFRGVIDYFKDALVVIRSVKDNHTIPFVRF